MKALNIDESFDSDGKKIKKIPAKKIVKKAFSDEISDDDDDEDDDGEMYLKKFDREVNENYILNNHPECMMQNYDEILARVNNLWALGTKQPSSRSANEVADYFNRNRVAAVK